jgi:3-hydroxyacyl-CoA dehydrogenase
MNALGGIVNDHAIIASNTSSIPIAQLASKVPNPARQHAAGALSDGRGTHVRGRFREKS